MIAKPRHITMPASAGRPWPSSTPSEHLARGAHAGVPWAEVGTVAEGPASLPELLARSFGPAELAALENPDADPLDEALLLAPASPVPQGVWEDALLGPARDILSRPSKRFRADLVAAAWRLAGGGDDLPASLPLLLEIVHAGSLVIDDVEDDSSCRRGAATVHRLHGVPLAINTGNWLYFWPFQIISELPVSADAKAEIARLVSRAMFRCHFGQALDLSAQVGRLPQAWVPSVVRAATSLKTGALMELAASLGATAAGAHAELRRALARFGRRLGIGLQMLDDMGNIAPPTGDVEADSKRHEDLRLGRPTWPWAWAAEQLDETAFASLQSDARVLAAAALAGAPFSTESVAATLRSAAGLRGRGAARVYLERALADVERAVGPAPELAPVREIVARLEVSYA